MAHPIGVQRTLDYPERPVELNPNAVRAQPASAPVATTIVLFAVVAALLGFIAWL